MRRLGTTVMLGRMVVGRPANEDGRRWGERSAMVQKPPGNGTVAPDGDDLHLEAVTVEGIGTVLVLDVRGRLGEVAEPAYLSVLLGLAEEPAAVVCDMSGVTGPADHESVALLASLGVEVEQWPGVPIAVVCPDRQLREALAARPDSRHLMVEPEREPALGRLLTGRPPSVVRRSLEPDPRSAGAAREVVTTACDQWGMSSVSASATLVVSELVTNALRTPAATWGCRWRGGGAGCASRCVTPAASGRSRSRSRRHALVVGGCSWLPPWLTPGGSFPPATAARSSGPCSATSRGRPRATGDGRCPPGRARGIGGALDLRRGDAERPTGKGGPFCAQAVACVGGAPSGTRTPNPLIKSQLLCQLS